MTDHYLYSLIAFSATDLIGYNRFLIIKKTFSNISDFLELPVTEQTALLGLKSEKSHKILQNMKTQADFIIQQCTKKNISFITHHNPLYPKSLKEIPDPPYLLYAQGNINPHIPLIAVIGTRKSTIEAEKINRSFCERFVHYGVGVISGLAQGHDAMAAKSVLDYDGYTVGVLGTAIDTIYPKSSQYLFHQIREKGILLSEYPPGMTSTKWRFPRRNRIVSGMAQAICVIQAPKQSGTMITVKMALEHQKDVYVIPGNPLLEQNQGSNLLIAQGAKIALDPDMIIQEVLNSHPNLETIQFIAQTHQKSPTPLPNISPEEEIILALVQEHIHIDEILRSVEINITSLHSLLTMMELKGLIIQKPGQIYIKGQ
ncbi:MAG: DNA-processing protein DprA [Brevinema sp.]